MNSLLTLAQEYLYIFYSSPTYFYDFTVHCISLSNINKISKDTD